MSQSNDDELYLASAAKRDAYHQEVSKNLAVVAKDGFEPQTAGYYLVRPVSDPMWKPKFSELTSSGGFEWYYAKEVYSPTQYQDRLGPTYVIGAGQNFTVDCMISLSRFFSNRMATASRTSETGGTYGVQATFDSRAIAALRTLLAHKSDTAGVEYVDWFDITRPSGSAETEMKAVAVAANHAYLPFSVQDITNGSAPVSVAVATGLTQSQANDLASRLNGP